MFPEVVEPEIISGWTEVHTVGSYIGGETAVFVFDSFGNVDVIDFLFAGHLHDGRVVFINFAVGVTVIFGFFGVSHGKDGLKLNVAVRVSGF